MPTFKVLNVNSKGCESEQTKNKSVNSSPVRIAHGTKIKLDKILQRANKVRHGRKLKPDDLISYSLSLLTEDHLSEIRESTMTNKDRIDDLFAKLLKKDKGMTREKFLGMLLAGKLSD